MSFCAGGPDLDGDAIEAAYELFSRQGIRAVGIDSIVESEIGALLLRQKRPATD